MAILELSEERREALPYQVQVHTINEDDLRLLIEGAPNELSTYQFDPVYVVALEKALSSRVFVTSDAGSTYEITFYGPTLEKEYHDTTVKVRQATYVVTTKEGVQTEQTRYINLINDHYARLRFFKTTVPEEDPGENSYRQVPSTKAINKIRLVIDWSSE